MVRIQFTGQEALAVSIASKYSLSTTPPYFRYAPTNSPHPRRKFRIYHPTVTALRAWRLQSRPYFHPWFDVSLFEAYLTEGIILEQLYQFLPFGEE